ncbi:PREDICTED: uncharacterized protein LOC104820871 [Tarenaya hassleriana]|uniref:uncharacterized protein LOC104820871 n=1 Tax=Tarenaya hassleriana TaxID=28532 RepID=UPI00053CA530|nr:PREDICTED: uncharacterized protein LOC104820871 [Tarenaya hassleriana]
MYYQEQMESLYLGEERRRRSRSCVQDADAESDEAAISFSSPKSPEDSDLFGMDDDSSPSSRKGLSKHYKGKSQSFTSLSDAKTLEDLAKPENPFNAKLKQRRERRIPGASCGGDAERNRGGRDGMSTGNDRPPRLPGHRPPLRAQTLSAAPLSALLTQT